MYSHSVSSPSSYRNRPLRSPHKHLSLVTTETNQVFGFNAPSPLTVSSTAGSSFFYTQNTIIEENTITTQNTAVIEGPGSTVVNGSDHTNISLLKGINGTNEVSND